MGCGAAVIREFIYGVDVKKKKNSTFYSALFLGFRLKSKQMGDIDHVTCAVQKKKAQILFTSNLFY